MTTRTPKTPRSAFTLVELLVVIGILGVLLSILLPSLASARSSARTSVCLSNLRQLSAGWNLYADQNNGNMVSGRQGLIPNNHNLYDVGNGMHYRPRWFVQIGAAAGFYPFHDNMGDKNNNSVPDNEDDAMSNRLTIINPVFLCPTNDDWTNNRNYTYGYNYQFLGNARWSSTTQRRINWPVKIERIIGPSKIVVAADCLGTSASFEPLLRTAYDADGTNTDVSNWGNHGWALDPPRLLPTSDRCDNNALEYRSGPDPRHAERANFVYGDGHASTLKPEAVGYRRALDGSYPDPVTLPGDAPHNRSFSLTGEDQNPPNR
jgi:prepilin-type N-terminal cleavage/methylation domain-containing protein/prepilin-type processing-associated H-X9-DG protein